MKKNSKIYIAGHTGLVGSALIRRLKKDGFTNIITISSSELNLIDEADVWNFFNRKKPEYVFLAAGRVGGIIANKTYPAEFIYENLRINCNIIHSAYRAKVKKLLYIGCSCLYPKDCPQPMKEGYLLTGPFEPTSEAYSVAKLAGLKMCQAYNHQYKTNFISCIPDSLFGPNDKFDSMGSHVIPALITKFHKAKVENRDEVTIWGTGKPRRGFLYVDDFADACIFLMMNYNSPEVINVGLGREISIRELASLIRKVVGFKGGIKFDSSKPDGAPRKYVDIKRMISLGWKAKMPLRKALVYTYRWYLENHMDKGKRCQR